jgi:hypothetical protein
VVTQGILEDSRRRTMINIQQGEPYFLFVAVGADAGGCEDGRTVGEFLADIVSDAKAAGSSNDQARFQGYQVNLVIISCFTVDPI